MPATTYDLVYDEREEALQHLQFQMSLLRLTALPAEGKGAVPENLRQRQDASSADLRIEELVLSANHSASSRRGTSV